MSSESQAIAGAEENRQRQLGVEPGLRYAIQVLEQVLNRGQNGAIGSGLAIAIVELKMEIERL